MEILKDEVNVKKITVDEKMKEEIQLDTEITHELKEEGWLRDLIRMVQDLRQDAKLEPKDKVMLHLELPAELLHVVEKNKVLFKKEVNAKTIDYHRTEKFDVELKTNLEEWPVWITIAKR